MGNEELIGELKKMFEYTNAVHVSPEPVFQGTSAQLAPVFARLGKLPTIDKTDVPGWIDNLATALESDAPVLLRHNRAGETVPARWYEYVEDGSVFMSIGDYFGGILHGLNSLLESGNRAKLRVGNDIDKIRRDYPVSQMSTEDFAEQMFKAEMEKAAEVAKERIRNTPIKLKYKRGTEEGEIEVIPAMTSNFPWYNLGGLGGVAEGSEGFIRPKETKFGGKPSYKTVPSETFDNLFTEYNTLAKRFQNYTIESERHIRDVKIDLTKYKTFLNTIKEKGG